MCKAKKPILWTYFGYIRAQLCQCVDFNNIACTMQFLNIIWTCEKYFYRQFTNGKSDHKMNLSAIDRMELHWAEIFRLLLKCVEMALLRMGFSLKQRTSQTIKFTWSLMKFYILNTTIPCWTMCIYVFGRKQSGQRWHLHASIYMISPIVPNMVLFIILVVIVWNVPIA